MTSERPLNRNAHSAEPRPSGPAGRLNGHGNGHRHGDGHGRRHSKAVRRVVSRCRLSPEHRPSGLPEIPVRYLGQPSAARSAPSQENDRDGCDDVDRTDGGLPRGLGIKPQRAPRGLPGIDVVREACRCWRPPGTMSCMARAAGSAFAGSLTGFVVISENEKALPVERAGSRDFAGVGWGKAKCRTGQLPGRAFGEGSRCGFEVVAPRSFAIVKRRAGRSPEAAAHQAVAGRSGRRSLHDNDSEAIVSDALRCSERRPGPTVSSAPTDDADQEKRYDLNVSSSRFPLPRVLGIGVVLTGILLANIYWTSFVAREHTLYTADHVAYWSLTSSLADDLRESPFGALRGVARSVAEDELNLLPALPLAPVLIVAGDSRTSWILTVLNVYAIPALLLGWWAFRRLDGIRQDPAVESCAGWAWLAAIGLFAGLWQPLSLGYLGIGGLVLAFAVYGLWLGPLPTSTRDAVLRALLIAALLAVLVFFRRWYAFWSLAFCLLVACETARDIFVNRRRGWKAIRGVLTVPLAVAGGLLAVLLLLGGPRLMTMVGTDYANRYSHYKVHDRWAAEVGALIHEFGILPLLAASVGFVLLLRSRGGRRTALFVGGQTLLAALLFRRVQDPSPQHWYVLVPGLLVLCASGLALVLVSLDGKRRRLAAAAGAVMALWLAGGVLGIGTCDAIALRPRGPSSAGGQGRCRRDSEASTFPRRPARCRRSVDLPAFGVRNRIGHRSRVCESVAWHPLPFARPVPHDRQGRPSGWFSCRVLHGGSGHRSGSCPGSRKHSTGGRNTDAVFS